MLDLFFGNNAGWFTLPAFVGTFFFTLRLVLLLMGGASDADFDAGGDFDSGGDFESGGDVGETQDHTDPGDAFKLLSIQSIATFLMGFGWAGLGAYRGSGWEWPFSLLCAAAGGVGMVWLLGLLLKFVYDFQSSGNININDAYGTEGTVYVSIPKDGKRGQVRVVIKGRQRIFNAVTEGTPIDSRCRVRVTRVNRDNTLTVVAI